MIAKHKAGLYMRLKKLLLRIMPRYAYFPVIFTPLLNLAVYYGCFLLTSGRTSLYDLSIPLDARVPFWPPAISVYVLSYAFWVVNYVLIARESRAHCYRTLAADWIAKVLCVPFFLLLPATIVRPDASGSGLWLWITRIIYASDAPRNLFPSIHCLESWFAWRGLFGCKRVPRWYKAFSFVFALMVCASTVLVKQHVLVDIPAGILLVEIGLLATRRIHPRSTTDLEVIS